MEWLNVIKYLGAMLAVFSTYLWGYHQGSNSEELKNARVEISNLNATLTQYEHKQADYEKSLSDNAIAISRERDELDWMRQQLAAIEARAKTDADRNCLRFQRLAVEKEELLNEAQRGLEFCYKNHR